MVRTKSRVPEHILKSLFIPSCIFSDRTLSFSESLIEYLHNQTRLSPPQIGEILCMDRRNVWTMIQRISHKRNGTCPTYDLSNNIFIPISIFQQRTRTSLGTIVTYLKEKGIRNSDISAALGRSEKTIWTVCDRLIRGDRR